MIIGSAGIALCLISVSLVGVAASDDQPIIKGIFFALYMVFFGSSYGPIMWVYMAEILPEKGFTVAMGIYWVCHVLNLGIQQVIISYTDKLYIACFVYFGFAVMVIYIYYNIYIYIYLYIIFRVYFIRYSY